MLFLFETGYFATFFAFQHPLLVGGVGIQKYPQVFTIVVLKKMDDVTYDTRLERMKQMV
jgi:hypothetical protein